MTITKPKLRFSRKLLAIPYAIFLFVFVVAPLLIILYYAFTNGDTGKLSFENFANFFSGTGGQTFFESSRFKTIVQSFGISIASTLICLLIAYPVAYIIAQSHVKNKMGLLLLFIVPMWVNFVLRINALKELLNWIGVYNKSNGWNIFNTILGMVYDFLPFMILPIYTTISKIDKSYLEAAKDLGAGGVSAFVKVTLPLSKAGIMSGISMVFLPSMTNYVVSNYMTFNHTKIIGAFIDECFRNDLWNLGSVTALLLLTLMFLITWLTGGFSTESETQSRGTSLW
ncbi:MAG: ABC transporter permease [Clostridiales bacterium]|nr:ABC transporter permease [Clostridiales bacterium]MBO5335087.1 ABC transporter permease [Clostridia bacterium]